MGTENGPDFGMTGTAPGLWDDLRDALGLRPRPIRIAQIEVTTICAGRCTYCPRTNMRPQWEARHMQASTFNRLWPLLRATRRVHLQGWGEPLSHPHFLDMVAVARKAGCLVSTTTSGQHMTPELAEALVASGMDIIAFSLAGTSATTNDCLRRNRPFATVMNSIRLLQQIRRARQGVHLELHIAYLLLASRLEDIFGLPALLDELDLHAAVVSILEPALVPELREECFLPQDQVRVSVAREILEKTQQQIRRQGREMSWSLPGPEDTGRCFEGAQKNAFIDVNGTMASCVYQLLPTGNTAAQARTFGSCLTANPMHIWNSSAYVRFRMALDTATPDPVCRTCSKRFAVGN